MPCRAARRRAGHARPFGPVARWSTDDQRRRAAPFLRDLAAQALPRRQPALAARPARRTLASLHRLADLTPRVLLPAHGPIPANPCAAFATALGRAQRLVDDPAGAVWYGARRIFAFALMIRGGIPVDEVEFHLLARVWLTEAARRLDSTPQALAAELVETMVRGGAIVLRDKRVHATAEHTPVAGQSLRVIRTAPKLDL